MIEFIVVFIVGVVIGVVTNIVIGQINENKGSTVEIRVRGFDVGDSVEHKLMGWSGTITNHWSHDGGTNYVNFKIDDELVRHSVNNSEIRHVT